MLELLFTISNVNVEECLYVNKSLNNMCSAYRVWISLICFKDEQKSYVFGIT